MLADQLDFVAPPFSPAHIHAFQHLSPILTLSAAGACVDFDVSVVAVRLARQQRLDFAGVHFPLQLAQARFRLGDDAVIPFILTESDKGEIIVELAGDAREGGNRGFDLLAFAHQTLRARCVVPKVRRLYLAIEFGEPRLCSIRVKDASGAKTGIR